MGPRWRLVLVAFWGSLFAPHSWAEVDFEHDSKSPAGLPGTTPCWRMGDFVVAVECGRCTSFQRKTMPECSATGFVDQINCSASKKGEFKSCRSAEMEAHLFWKFEGTMLAAAAIFALLVVCRQRLLDCKALEKVRKQIESI